MNQVSEVVTTLIHYKVAVRDTLEYTLKKDTYDARAYKEKKRSILIELEQKTPLKSIIDNSGENGKRLEETIRNFYNDVYGDESSILKLADDGLRVDHAQHEVIFKNVIPIHENVEAMIRGIIADAKKKNIDVSIVERVDKDEERLYRAVAFLTLTNDLIKLFGDYNQARREAKGEESAASRFIGNDIANLIKHVMTIRANSHLTDERYMGVQDKVVRLCEYMTGRRDLPSGEGFQQVIKETQDAVSGYLREVEPAFRASYVPLLNELIAQAKANNNKIAPTEGSAQAAPKEVDGEPVELDPKTGLPRA